MKEVTKDEFYSVIGPKNVVTSINNEWNDEHGYKVYFKERYGLAIVGYTMGSASTVIKPKYFLM